MMKYLNKFIYSGLLFVFPFFSSLIHAQSDTCLSSMKSANTNYEQGNYDDAIKLLISALAKCPLSKDDKIQANKLLISCYIATNNIARAKLAAATIMRLNPNYKPDKFKESPLVTDLFAEYKPIPVFDIGMFGGINFPSIHVIKTYSIINNPDQPGLNYYKNKTEFQVGAKGEYRVYKNFWLEADLEYRKTSYEHDLENIYNQEETYVEKIEYFDIPLSAKYYFLKKDIHPYVEAGIDFSFLSSALSTTSFSGQQDIVNRTSLRNRFSLGYFSGLGCSYRYNNFLFFAGIRYIYFPQTVNKAGTRFNDPLNLWKYYYIDDDFSMNNMQINMGAAFILKFRKVKR
jgi:outer membrane protein W